ncbi:hypothetical protein BC332_23749 [Capsicum chinense]|nr:hypothetical protein BC332_23749 [Capsicum chinense]
MFLSKQQENKVFFYHGKDIFQSSNGGVIKHKRSSYNQSPNMTPKNMNEKSVSSSATEVSKGLNDVIVNNVPSTEAHKAGLNAKSDMLDKERKEAKSKDESLKKLEESLHNLMSKANGQEHVNKTQQDKIKELKI